MSIASGVFKSELCETEINFHCAFYFSLILLYFATFFFLLFFAFAFATFLLYAAATAAFDYSSCSVFFFVLLRFFSLSD